MIGYLINFGYMSNERRQRELKRPFWGTFGWLFSTIKAWMREKVGQNVDHSLSYRLPSIEISSCMCMWQKRGSHRGLWRRGGEYDKQMGRSLPPSTTQVQPRWAWQGSQHQDIMLTTMFLWSWLIIYRRGFELLAQRMDDSRRATGRSMVGHDCTRCGQSECL